MRRVALLGNPNTGKTTLFNRLCGVRHRTSNFPGTTQEARVGFVRATTDEQGTSLIDLPGTYSLAIDQPEAELCRGVLAGERAPKGEPVAAPDVLCIVVDATNLARNLTLVGEALGQRLPTVIALNMVDLAKRAGVKVDPGALSRALGCDVVPICARSGDNVEALAAAFAGARIPNTTPPGDRAGLERWADDVHAIAALAHAGDVAARRGVASAHTTDLLDRVFTNPVGGLVSLGLVMGGLFYVIFALAAYPMDWIEQVFSVLTTGVDRLMPAGILRDLLSEGVVAGIGATVVFVPQIALLFFLISLLEDTGYLARAALMMDRYLRPFGLPGHSFVPLLSSHACALPGITAARTIPDRRERLATILVAPFMTCAARIPVYVLLIGILFAGRPFAASLAFIACYVLGIVAGLVSALIARRTVARGTGRAMALELPTYKRPSVRTAALTSIDRSWMFIRNAGTNILAICIVLWWLGAFPRVAPPTEATALREQAMVAGSESSAQGADLLAQADRLEAMHAKERSYLGRLGQTVEPVFAPLGYDWQLTIGVLSSFAAREVFVATMAVVVTGVEDDEDEGILAQVAGATRDDGTTPIFTPATCWSLLVFYVLAMQCLPTLAVTAREAGGVRWALLQLAWMSAVAYVGALIAFRVAG